MRKQSKLGLILVMIVIATSACNFTPGSRNLAPEPTPIPSEDSFQEPSPVPATPTQPPSLDLATPTPRPTNPPEPTSTPDLQGNFPRVSNNGGFGDCPENLTCERSFSAETLSVVNAHFTYSDKNGEGVEYVNFSVWDANESVKFYERTERVALYCTFGGDGPCNTWLFENGAFRWYSGGDPVEPGDYVVVMIIQGTTPDVNGNSEGQMRHLISISIP